MSKSNSNIHPNAVVEKGAKIGDGVTIEAYAVIKSTVTLEDRTVIKSHAYIDGYTTIGEGTTVYPGASIGTKPQDLKFRGEKTFVKIGKNCEIREFVTINSSCQENSVVQLGDNCLIMAYCHIAHNCTLGNRVIMSNNATLAGHVTVEDYAIVAAMTPIHQFVRIGGYAMVGGLSRVTHDIPPYTIGGGIPFKFGGLNIIGLKRHGFPLKTRIELSKAFKLLYRSKLHMEEALKCIEEEVEPLPEIKHWLKFCRESKRGLMGLQGVTNSEENYELIEEENEY
jgi:UDP-N-acetylglucosamine acyltransferase